MPASTPLPNSFRFGLLSVSILTFSLFASAQPTNAQGFGTIKGTLVWGGAKLPQERPFVVKGDKATKDADICAAEEVPNENYVVDAKTNGVANAFAYVVGPKGKNPEAEAALLKSAPTVVMDQKGCRFMPHAVAVHKGQTLVFKSSDSIGHNVRYFSGGVGADNRMIAPLGKHPVNFVSTDRHPVEVKCDLHTWMTGYFMVFDHPFFAVTKPDGTFEIKGVPAGPQNIIVRHDKVGFITTGGGKGLEVDVKADEVTDVGEFKLVPKD